MHGGAECFRGGRVLRALEGVRTRSVEPCETAIVVSSIVATLCEASERAYVYGYVLLPL